MNRAQLPLACAGLLAATAAMAADEAKATDPISTYLVDMSPGAVSAGEMLGLSPSAISNLQAPKDFVAAINTLSSGNTKQGFGLSFTPGRTRYAPVSIDDYSHRLGSRIWAGTSFSYAQNQNTLAGIDYKQEAVALHIAYYLNKDDDPAVAGYQGFARCAVVRKQMADEGERSNAMFEALRKQGLSAEAAANMVDAFSEKNSEFSARTDKAVAKCVDDAVAKAKAKWNANQIAITFGQARIQGPAAGAPHLSLGHTASLSAALGPNEWSLVNLTVRRTSKELDLKTIATTPDYKTSTLAAARWTYGMGDARDTYALAEISNAKASSNTLSNRAFKYALGVDKRLTEGLWLELRVGKNRSADGATEQTTALMNLKLSPTSTLPKP